MISTLSLLTLPLSVFVFVPGHPVQEDERNSSEDHTSPHSDQDLSRWSQTGTSFTSTAPVGQEVASGREGARGRLYEALESSSGLQSVSSPSPQDQGLLHPTSPLQGLAVAGRADRETLPLPEEEPNNRADTSGAAHLADGPMSARERTHPYFQRALSTDTLFHTSHTVNTETNSNNGLPRTQRALTHATAGSSNTLLGTDIPKYKVVQTSKLSTTTQAHPTVSSSSSSDPPLTSSPPELPSWRTWESGTILSPRGGAVSGASGEKLRHSWRSQRSTDRLNSDLTSAVTSDPLISPTNSQQDDSSSAHTDAEPTPLPSSSQGPSRTSATHITGLDTAVGTVEAASLHPNISRTDSFVPAASDVSSRTAAFESSDENTEILHIFTSSARSPTNSPQSTESVKHSSAPYTSSPFTQISKEETQTATQSTQRHFTNTLSSSPDITKADDWTGSSTPRAALTLGDVVQNSAATGTTTDTESYTLRPTYTLLHDNAPPNSQTPTPRLSSSASIHSSTPSYTLQTRTTFPGISHSTHTILPLPSTTAESAARTPLIDHKTMSVPSQISTIKSTSSHTSNTHNHLPLPSSTNVPATPKQSHDYITTTHTSLLSLTTAKSDYGHGDREVDEEKEDESQQFSSNTTTQTPTAGPPRKPWPRTTTHPSQENHTALTASVLTSVPTWSSTTTQTPKFYIVPDQPAAIRGIVHICV